MQPAGTLLPHLTVEGEGYKATTLAGVTSRPPEDRSLGTIVAQSREELGEFETGKTSPWCLFVSVPEPHDPYVVGLEAYRRYDDWDSPPPGNWLDDLAGRPRIYQRAASAFAGLSDEDRTLAARCYYASVTEIDQQFGLILDELDDRGLADKTVVVLLTDHGDYLGAHGMYCKNIGAWEEAYNVPLVVAGPGIGAGTTSAPLCSSARVGTHALFPSLMRHYGIPSSIDCDAPLFDDVLAAASGDKDGDSLTRLADALERADANHREGLAEYHGGRLLLTQRIFYRDEWKLVWNGFDDHEFYDLATDSGELVNLAAPDGAAHDRSTRAGTAYRELSAAMWREIERTGDRTLLNSQYVGLRASEIGPEARNW
ncbi:MAG: sulfatase-like hydrolase/transferase [Spirochaetota bacterium]